jgi:hypothetical protein
MAGLYGIESSPAENGAGGARNRTHGRELGLSGFILGGWHGYYPGLRALNLAPYGQAKAFPDLPRSIKLIMLFPSMRMGEKPSLSPCRPHQ